MGPNERSVYKNISIFEYFQFKINGAVEKYIKIFLLYQNYIFVSLSVVSVIEHFQTQSPRDSSIPFYIWL